MIDEFFSNYLGTLRILNVDMDIVYGSPAVVRNRGEYGDIKRDFLAIDSPESADVFFEIYGPGNSVDKVDRPYERMRAYEQLLAFLRRIDYNKYNGIHKGTPYYFIAWTAYQAGLFSKSFIYMDLAASEDLHFKGHVEETPAIACLLLNEHYKRNFHKHLVDAVKRSLADYKSMGYQELSLEKLRNFSKSLLFSPDLKTRSLLTALFSFILDYEERLGEIRLRSHRGGSIQPFLDHLFDGARLWESLLQYFGSNDATLRPKIQFHAVELSLTDLSILKSNQTLQDASIIYDQHEAENSPAHVRDYAASFVIRNTTGHTLIWDDTFNDEGSYTKLYKALLGTLFYTISKLYSENT